MATGLSIASVGLELFQTGKSIVDAKKTKDEIAAFQQQDLINPAENIGLATRASEQRTEAANISFATSVAAAQQGGARSVFATLPRISEANILLQEQISADIERQERERDILIARGESEIQRIREGREQLALQGLGTRLNVEQQGIQSGISNVLTSGLALTESIKLDKENKDDKD